MTVERSGVFHESIPAVERRFKRMIENKFDGSLEVAEKLLEIASCDKDGYKIVTDTFNHTYAIEIDCPELEVKRKTKLIFNPDNKSFWLEISNSGNMGYGETNIEVDRMELNKDKTQVVIIREDNGRKMHLNKDGKISIVEFPS